MFYMFEGNYLYYVTFIFIKHVISMFHIELKFTIFAFENPFKYPRYK